MSDILLGLDTSNYTSSAAVFCPETNEVIQSKHLLPVKKGERGIRQSDAVFHHTVLLPQMTEALGEIVNDASAVGVSVKPSCREGSYMPCFLVGQTAARMISCAKGIPVFETTHQTGHILAAMYSAQKLALLHSDKQFLAFHVSGGTTDLLLCTPDAENALSAERIGGTADLNAGQAVDRCGVMLGLSFPCGAELEKLATKCDEKIKIKPSVKGMDCSLSGIENKCKTLFEKGAPKEYIAAFCLKSVESAVEAVTKAACGEFGKMPVIFAGGVMSNKIIAKALSEKFDAYFALPEFSCDNAVGTAVYAAFKKGLI